MYVCMYLRVCMYMYVSTMPLLKNALFTHARELKSIYGEQDWFISTYKNGKLCTN